MSVERRTGEQAVPDNVADYLNELQQVILEKINKFGWSLLFVRRSSSEEPVVVIQDKDAKKFGVMEAGGAIDFESDILFRAE